MANATGITGEKETRPEYTGYREKLVADGKTFKVHYDGPGLIRADLDLFAALVKTAQGRSGVPVKFTRIALLNSLGLPMNAESVCNVLNSFGRLLAGSLSYRTLNYSQPVRFIEEAGTDPATALCSVRLGTAADLFQDKKLNLAERLLKNAPKL